MYNVIELRRMFHKIPEVGFNEIQTSALIAKLLDENGIAYKKNIAGTGLLVTFGEGHPHIAFRAEIDGLPIQETNDFDYKSQHECMMHACGHDCHIAALIDTVVKTKKLFDSKKISHGAVTFIFQPCEETKNDAGKSGGQIIADLPEMFEVDYYYAAHIESTLESGKVFIRDGALTAAIDRFDIKVTGQAGHGAYPHNAIDPIWLTCNAIQTINSLESRTVNTAIPSVISVCMINGGNAWNAIPSEVKFSGTIRTFNQTEREKIHNDMEASLQIIKAFGGDYELVITKGNPSVVNSREECSVVRNAVEKALGQSAISDIDIQMGGDDFSYYSNKKPSCYFYVGAKKDKVSRQHHSGNFDIDENSILKIVSIFLEIIKEKLA